MQLTKFLKLRKAVESLDPNHIGKKLRELDTQLKSEGLLLKPEDTAITQEGIFYIEPRSGIATKVIAYVSDYVTHLSPEQRSNLSESGYTDSRSIEKFHRYHLMRCNVLTASERAHWVEPYRLTRRLDGTFYYRIVSEATKKRPMQVYQEIDGQRLYVCENCLWKVSSILVGTTPTNPKEFSPNEFFDVNCLRSWNSFGELSKDFGFMTNMYPEDWIEITRVRKEQTHYRCEYCYRDLSHPKLREYLHVNPTDYIENDEGYVRLECLCLACVAELPGKEQVKKKPELQRFHQLMNAVAPDESVAEAL